MLTCLSVYRCERRWHRRLTRPAGRGCAALPSSISHRPSTRSRICAPRSSGRRRLEARAALIITATVTSPFQQQHFPNLAGAMVREALTHKAVIELRQNPPSPSPLPSAKGLPAGAPLPEVTRQQLYPPRAFNTATAKYDHHHASARTDTTCGVPRIKKNNNPPGGAVRSEPRPVRHDRRHTRPAMGDERHAQRDEGARMKPQTAEDS